MRRSLLTFAALSLGGIVLLGSCPAEARPSFGGFICVHSCAPYASGYRWAERARVTDPKQCLVTNSEAFRSGCLVYIQDPARGADTDDDGNEI
jgi:hypothetical protein